MKSFTSSPSKYVYPVLALILCVKGLHQCLLYWGTYAQNPFKSLRKCKPAFCLSAACRLSSFLGNMTKLQDGQLPSSAIFFTERVSIFQHKAETLFNFQLIPILYSLIVFKLQTPTQRSTKVKPHNRKCIHRVAVTFCLLRRSAFRVNR
jgi:hypothetical protein